MTSLVIVILQMFSDSNNTSELCLLFRLWDNLCFLSLDRCFLLECLTDWCICILELRSALTELVLISVLWFITSVSVKTTSPSSLYLKILDVRIYLFVLLFPLGIPHEIKAFSCTFFWRATQTQSQLNWLHKIVLALLNKGFWLRQELKKC